MLINQTIGISSHLNCKWIQSIHIFEDLKSFCSLYLVLPFCIVSSVCMSVCVWFTTFTPLPFPLLRSLLLYIVYIVLLVVFLSPHNLSFILHHRIRRVCFIGIIPLISAKSSRRSALGFVLAIVSSVIYREMEPFRRPATNFLMQVSQHPT